MPNVRIYSIMAFLEDQVACYVIVLTMYIKIAVYFQTQYFNAKILHYM